MTDIVVRLIESFQQILSSADLSSVGKLDSASQSLPDLQDLIDAFQGMHGFPCPASMQSGLVLPGIVDVRWQYNRDVKGEVYIPDLFSAMHMRLDESLQAMEIDGKRLGDMRIADAVLVNAGPLHVLFEVNDSGIAPDLYLFNARELRRLELDYERYLVMAAATRGVVFWQHLFCQGRMAQSTRNLLARELAFLSERFPSAELDELHDRLRTR